MTLANTSWMKDMYVKALKDGSSVAAVSKEGKLMGVRVGYVTRYMIVLQTLIVIAGATIYENCEFKK